MALALSARRCNGDVALSRNREKGPVLRDQDGSAVEGRSRPDPVSPERNRLVWSTRRWHYESFVPYAVAPQKDKVARELVGLALGYVSS